jgi:hypothetical protein
VFFALAAACAITAGAARPACTQPSPVTADPWTIATADPALAKIYVAVGARLATPPPERPTPASLAADSHITARLRELRRTDPNNGFPIYLLALMAARRDDWKSVTALLREGNAAPRVVYPISEDVLTREYGAAEALRMFAAMAASPLALRKSQVPPGQGPGLNAAAYLAMMQEFRTMGNRIARQAEPRTPILVANGGVIRALAEQGISACHEREGRTADAARARAAAAQYRAWTDASMRQFEKEVNRGSATGAEAIGARYGITADDIRNQLLGQPLTSARARQQYPAFNRSLLLDERRMADRDLRNMPADAGTEP